MNRGKMISPYTCPKCGGQILMNQGQLVYWHKECRAEGRRLLNKTRKQLAKTKTTKPEKTSS